MKQTLVKTFIILTLLSALLMGCNRATDTVASSSIGKVQVDGKAYALNALPVLNGNYALETAKNGDVSQWRLKTIKPFSVWDDFSPWGLSGLAFILAGAFCWILNSFLATKVFKGLTIFRLLAVGTVLVLAGITLKNYGGLIALLALLFGLYEAYRHNKELIKKFGVNLWGKFLNLLPKKKVIASTSTGTVGAGIDTTVSQTVTPKQ
jgi:hypothetical protein